MLSGETAAGKYPVAALKAMVAIAETTEADSSYNSLVHHAQANETRLSVSAAMAHAACTTAQDIQASAIITVSKSGMTARLLSPLPPGDPDRRLRAGRAGAAPAQHALGHHPACYAVRPFDR